MFRLSIRGKEFNRMIHKTARSYELSASEPHIIPKKGRLRWEIKRKEAIFHSNYYFCWPVMFQTNSAFHKPLHNFLISHLLTALELKRFVHSFMLWYQMKIHLEIAKVNLTQGLVLSCFASSSLFVWHETNFTRIFFSSIVGS